MISALRRHWPEYLMEAAGLGLFMISAGVATTLLEYPGSPLHAALPDPLVRRALIGLAMGLTAVGLIYSPWGQQSGAHFNPAVTLTFLRLGKVEFWDAAFYVAFQFAGGVAGVVLVSVVLRGAFDGPPVRFVVTQPGAGGPWVAFTAEALISFGLMAVVLVVSNRLRLARWTGVFAGVLIAVYIALEAPLSGMSLNPARTFASALPAHLWTALWVYFTAPILGMLAAAELYRRLGARRRVYCAKLNHHTTRRCIFRCEYAALAAEGGEGESR
jgi:aquaporin Z